MRLGRRNYSVLRSSIPPETEYHHLSASGKKYLVYNMVISTQKPPKYQPPNTKTVVVVY
jgi:hypothetical protein